MEMGYKLKLQFKSYSRFSGLDVFFAGWFVNSIGKKIVGVTVDTVEIPPKIFLSRLSAYFTGKAVCRFNQHIKKFYVVKS